MGQLLFLLLLAVSPPAEGPASAELRRIVEADQAVRQDFAARAPDAARAKAWKDGDEARLRRVRELLDRDQVITAEDYGEAALIFQHSLAIEDTLTAHELYLLAAIGGPLQNGLAISEDRLLLRLGRKQRFGGQFTVGAGGKQVIENVDEEAGAAVTDALRLEFLTPPLKLAREKGILKAMDEIEASAGRLAQEWQAGRSASRQHAELGTLAARPSSPVARRRVVEIYRADGLRQPEEYREAAAVLAGSDDPRELLLAHELAMLSASKGDHAALHLFASTLDRYLLAIGKPPRYATSPAASVPPCVRRALGVEAQPR